MSGQVGEDVRILDLTDRPTPDLPEQDFWMSDDAAVVATNYRQDGTRTGRELLENPGLEQYRRWKRLTLEADMPFKEYRQA